MSYETTPDVVLEIYYFLLLARTFEQRLEKLYRQGQILGGVFSGIGQECVTVGATFDLAADDVVLPLHRDIGMCLARGVSPKILMAQILGKEGGPSNGRSDYLHTAMPEFGIYGSTSMLASSYPIACGVGMAFQAQRSNRVVLAPLGDGGTSRGDFHEALNFASVRRLPVVFVIENNYYAYSTPLSKQMAIKEIAHRAEAYGMPGVAVNGNDLMAVRHAAEEAVTRARDWVGPSLIECRTYRWHGHS
jgi:TPP-dependent pyruvate/acetoin dehydrogenase alpha subunit